MNKVAAYLNEHLMGEVISGGHELNRHARDASQLLILPEMIVKTASTSDIRKVMRFCWQLAEKGHVLAASSTGQGTGAAGAALGSGISIQQSKYMSRVVGIDPKQRLVHVQSGASVKAVNMVLSTHSGMILPYTSFVDTDGTIGGAIASGAIGRQSSRYGSLAGSVRQLEVVLANGDVLQTSKLSKRELNAKKGLHTMEGEVYRQIDNLIVDNQELISDIASRQYPSTIGYPRISQVKSKDGSFDLTPLFVGSEGTLGIISEAILQASFARQNLSVVVATYADLAEAHAACDIAIKQKAVTIELIDGRIIKAASQQGKVRPYMPVDTTGGVLIAIYDDFSEKTRDRLAKRLEKELSKSSSPTGTKVIGMPSSELTELHSLLAIAKSPAKDTEVVPGILSGIWLPSVRLSAFMTDLASLEAELSLEMPIFADVSSGLVDVLPVFDMKKVTDRQKMLKVISEIATLCAKHDGTMAAAGGEGRLSSLVNTLDPASDEVKLYQQIKGVFDPHNMLSPEVKTRLPVKELAAQINAWCRGL